jgi:hypothetical protein
MPGKEGSRIVSTRIFDEHGVRFEYPSGWEVEVTDGGSEVTVAVQEPSGLAFVLVTTDESGPDPADVCETALDAMSEEYPDLDVVRVTETIGDHEVTGHDVEFFALDIANAASIRSFTTRHRTVLFFGQWTELGNQDLADIVRSMFRSLEETGD